MIFAKLSEKSKVIIGIVLFVAVFAAISLTTCSV